MGNKKIPSYSRRERKVVIMLGIAALVLLYFLYSIGTKNTSTPPANHRDVLPDSSKGFTQNTEMNWPKHRGDFWETPRKPELFPFDPNTADSTQLLRLGLSYWQVRNIYKYRSMGGVYRSERDFAKLYGLSVHDFQRLRPYIRIDSAYILPASTLFEQEYAKEEEEKEQRQREREAKRHEMWPIKLKPGEQVTLNRADTNELKRIPGVGSYYANRIMDHGKWLGGYAEIGQLDEIDGLPKEVKQYVNVDTSLIKRLKINELELEQLRSHPYINFYQARDIIDLRHQGGAIKDISQLSLSPHFSKEDIRRLRPYVEY